MLVEKQLFETRNKEQEAIQLLQETKPEYLAFSGGKDSIVIKKLADMAGIKYQSYYNVTTIDPPELVYFIRQNYSDVKWNRPEKHILEKMLDKGFPPTRRQRWCCELYKENNGTGKIITGIRAKESPRRKNRRFIEFCFRNKHIIYINPILNWTESDIWEFIKKYNLKYCSLYNEGFKRTGCLFCPMAGNKNRLKEVNRYPQYKKLFIKYFQKLIEKRKLEDKPLRKWETGKQFFEWWLKY